MKASYFKHTLKFKTPSGTSRGVLTQKDSYIICLEDQGEKGFGECSLIQDLSIDNVNEFERVLQNVLHEFQRSQKIDKALLKEYPAISFGLETAIRSLNSGDPFIIYPSEFTTGDDDIEINGLIWMGHQQNMKEQIKEKIEAGFKCIKLKIGAIDFEEELELLKMIRNEYSADEIEIRVDANGAFQPKNAKEILNRLSELELHSIEQPIKQGQWDEMAKLCETTPLDIALDEELIGINSSKERQRLLETINPQYIILKPSLIGGLDISEQWIELADDRDIGWWVTSALESNIGLNAIAQWTYTLFNELPQGLGTGSLFTNNFVAPLTVKNGTLRYLPDKKWNLFKIDL